MAPTEEGEASTKRELSPPNAAPSAKRQRTGRVVSTVGLTEATVTELLLYAIERHPEAEEQHVRKARPTVLDGVGDTARRSILSTVAGEYEDIEEKVLERRKLDNEKAVDFSRFVAEANGAMHELDDLPPSKQFTHSGDVSSGVNETLEKIGEHVNEFSTEATKVAAIEALCEILNDIFNDTEGEIGKSLMWDLPESISRQIEDVAGMLGWKGRQEVLPTLESASATMHSFGLDHLFDLIREIQGEGEDDDTEQEEE